MYKIAVLVSGGGTNLQAIIDRIADGTIPDTKISLVVSNRRSAYALERAASAGIPTSVIHPKKFETPALFGEALTRVIAESGAQLVVLAGCLMTIPPPAQDTRFLEAMQELFLKTKELPGADMRILSMGMSDDYAEAIRLGSNLVRVGSALFGARHYPV